MQVGLKRFVTEAMHGAESGGSSASSGVAPGFAMVRENGDIVRNVWQWWGQRLRAVVAGARRHPRLAAGIGGGVAAVAAGVTALVLVLSGSSAPVKPAISS